MHGYRAFRHGISSLPPRRSLLTLPCSPMEREIRADVFTSCRVYPPRRPLPWRSIRSVPILPFENATRTGPDIAIIVIDLMHRVLPRFVLCVFSQSCLKARLHLLLMPCCCWISFIDTIKPRGGIYFILIFIQGEEMVIWWKGIWGISSSGKSINFLPFLSYRDKRDYFIKA